MRHSHTCWGTKGFSDLHDALNELKEIVLFATLKKKRTLAIKTFFSRKKKMNSRSSVRLLNIDGRTASFTTDIIWQNAWVWKKINYNRLQKLRNVILKTLFKVGPPLLYVYCQFFIYIQFQLLNVYLQTTLSWCKIWNKNLCVLTKKKCLNRQKSFCAFNCDFCINHNCNASRNRRRRCCK